MGLATVRVGAVPYSPGQFHFQACGGPWNGNSPSGGTPFQAILGGFQARTGAAQTDRSRAYSPILTGQTQSVRERRGPPVRNARVRRVGIAPSLQPALERLG